MRGGAFTASCAAVCAAAAAAAAQAPVMQPATAPTAQPSAEQTSVPRSTPTPFSAHYQAEWKSMNIGTSDLELKRDAEPGHYVYTWTITARGIFRLYRAQVTQRSWISIVAGHVRPEKYRADDGASTVDLDFDWNTRRASGVSEKKPVDLTLKEGMQDVMSIQVEVMLDLKNQDLPRSFQIIDKDEAKEFLYSDEGTVRIRTDLGELDTIVVSSARAGNNRVLRMWFAPSLGYAPVQAERTRDGKLEFAIRIRSLRP